MKRFIRLLFVVLLAAATASTAAAKDLPMPGAKDKCPVCGMFVAKYPDWTTIVLFKDGSSAFFDGVKDMFKYILDQRRYDASGKVKEIRAVMVKDYYRLSWIDARAARYVVGSDIFGPMGRELIPMEKDADAREFLKDHKGKSILMFNDVTTKVLKTLD